MITLADLFNKDQTEYAPDGAEVAGYSAEQLTKMQLRLVSAYAALFSGRGSKEDADLVLVDLSRFARYLDTTPLDLPAEQVKALDQRRAVIVRIIDAIVTAGGDVDGLHRAVLISPQLDAEEA